MPSTVTVAVAVLPLEVFAVMVAVPSETAVTVPPETFATLSLLDVHVTVLSVAFAGVTVAVKVSVLPVVRVRLDGEIVTPVASMILSFFVTVTFTVAVLPLLVVAVMVAVPIEIPFITPPDTVATLSLLDVHLTLLFVALEGVTVAFTVVVVA